ncbi:MAG: hypothetical protein VXY19_02045, partial [Bacteroidota bacterium]|nr:hypothetical protein [Bacteroidota bacterium]
MNREIKLLLFFIFFLSCSKDDKGVQDDFQSSNTTELLNENGSNEGSTNEEAMTEQNTNGVNSGGESEQNIVTTNDGPYEKYLTINKSITFQKVDGFGAGIKRRTEDLYRLPISLREKVEKYCFEELEVNMIRFFIYHDLEPVNDNDNPLELDESKLDWTPYDSDPNKNRTRYVGEALNNALL